MSGLIYPTLWDPTAALADLYLAVYDPSDGSTIRARSQVGIAQVAGQPIFYLTGGLTVIGGGIVAFDLAGVAYPPELHTLDIPSSIAPIVLPAGGVSPLVSQIFRIKRGDLEPIVFPITELDVSGAQVVQDVTGWTGNFKLRTAPDVGSIIINQPFYISDINGNVTTDGSDGLLAYAWAAHETDTSGQFLAEYECLRSDGIKKTYPTTSVEPLPGEYIQVHVIPDLDDAGSY